MIASIVLSILLGIPAGLLYGFSFLSQERRTLSFGLMALFTVGRISTFGLASYFLLLSGNIHFILFVTSFLLAFWIFLFNQKV